MLTVRTAVFFFSQKKNALCLSRLRAERWGVGGKGGSPNAPNMRTNRGALFVSLATAPVERHYPAQVWISFLLPIGIYVCTCVRKAVMWCTAERCGRGEEIRAEAECPTTSPPKPASNRSKKRRSNYHVCMALVSEFENRDYRQQPWYEIKILNTNILQAHGRQNTHAPPLQCSRAA